MEESTGQQQEQPMRPGSGEMAPQEQQHVKPMTYGDVFSAPGEVGKQPITPEDAALMQSAESMAFGRTQKGGAASVMQAAADYNVKTGAISKDAHNPVADTGVTVKETRAPGIAIDTEYVGDVPVAGMARPTPTSPDVAAATAVTIGEALEAAALGAMDQPVAAMAMAFVAVGAAARCLISPSRCSPRAALASSSFVSTATSSALSSVSGCCLRLAFGTRSQPLARPRRLSLVVRAGKTSMACTKRSRSRKSRARTQGFRVRMATPGGRNVLRRRRRKGRKVLVTQSNPSSGKRA